MKISMCIDIDRGNMRDIGEKFSKLKANGFDSCQLHTWHPETWTDENARILKEELEKYGITATSLWNGWVGPQEWDFYEGPLTLGLVPPEYRCVRMKNLCDGADFAHKIGITDVATHMGFIPEDPNDYRFAGVVVAIREVAKHLKQNGQYLLFETGQETPTTMLRCIERVGMDNLGINFDTANLICYGKGNPVDALFIFGKYVRNIHAKDTDYPPNGHELGEERRIGEGRVDFHGIFRKLMDLGYDSYITIEREIPEGEEQLQDILNGRDYIQKILDALQK